MPIFKYANYYYDISNLNNVNYEFHYVKTYKNITIYG